MFMIYIADRLTIRSGLKKKEKQYGFWGADV